jgi:hypothetical protein
MKSTWYSVRCNSCGTICGGQLDLMDEWRSALRYAQAQGWHHVVASNPSVDYCPTCWNKDPDLMAVLARP